MKASSSIIKLTTVAVTLGLMTGCAPMISGAMNATLTNEAVLTKTAKYFGVSEKEVTVSMVEKNTLDTSYKAKVQGKLYNCFIYYGDVACKQPGG